MQNVKQVKQPKQVNQKQKSKSNINTRGLKRYLNFKAKFDMPLFVITIILIVFGYIMVASAHANVYVTFGMMEFAKQMIKITVFILAGFLLMQFMTREFKLTNNINLLKKITYVVIAMMLATQVFPEVYGSKAWINLGFMTIQPSEFVKLLLVIWAAYYFPLPENKDKSLWEVMKKPLAVFVVTIAYIVLFQNDLGNAMIIAMICLVLFMALPDARFNKIKRNTFIGLVIILILFYIFGHRISDLIYALPEGFPKRAQLMRIAVLFNPLNDVYNSGFQVTNTLVALSAGGIFGMGLNNSTTKFLLPEPYNDAIIAVIAEELGLVGLLFLFFLYLAIVFRLLSFAEKKVVISSDRIILVGIATFFMAQFFVNIGGMVGLIPMTGVTLLFVSSGGSSILMAFMAMGIAQAVISKYLK